MDKRQQAMYDAKRFIVKNGTHQLPKEIKLMLPDKLTDLDEAPWREQRDVVKMLKKTALTIAVYSAMKEGKGNENK